MCETSCKQQLPQRGRGRGTPLRPPAGSCQCARQPAVRVRQGRRTLRCAAPAHLLVVSGAVIRWDDYLHARAPRVEVRQQVAQRAAVAVLHDRKLLCGAPPVGLRGVRGGSKAMPRRLSRGGGALLPLSQRRLRCCGSGNHPGARRTFLCQKLHRCCSCLWLGTGQGGGVSGGRAGGGNRTRPCLGPAACANAPTAPLPARAAAAAVAPPPAAFRRAPDTALELARTPTAWHCLACCCCRPAIVGLPAAAGGPSLTPRLPSQRGHTCGSSFGSLAGACAPLLGEAALFMLRLIYKARLGSPGPQLAPAAACSDDKCYQQPVCRLAGRREGRWRPGAAAAVGQGALVRDAGTWWPWTHLLERSEKAEQRDWPGEAKGKGSRAAAAGAARAAERTARRQAGVRSDLPQWGPCQAPWLGPGIAKRQHFHLVQPPGSRSASRG